MGARMFVVYARPWWRRPWGITLVGAVAAGVPAFVVWSTEPVVIAAPSPARVVPAVRHVAATVSPVDTVAPAPDAAPVVETPPVVAERVLPALSTQVAPGVHVTPIGVPPDGVAVPAGPRAEDSEPEN